MNNTLFRQRIFITGMFLALAGGIMAQTARHAVPVTVTDKGGKAAIAIPSDTTETDSIDRDMTLGELVVKADRVRRRPGGYTVSLTGCGLTKGKDMNRMLASLPGLAIENGSLTLQGQAPAAVYIDGVKASDMEMLKNLPPESVASVSVDWHAGREETAGTRGGVIRIKTKKVSGTAGTLSLTAEYSPGYGYTGETPTAYLSVGTRRMTITNNAAFAHQAPQGEYTEDRTMKATGAHTITTSDSHGWTRNLYDRLNISYDIAPRHSLGLMGYIAYADMKRHSNAESTGSDGATSLLRYDLPSHSLMAQAVAMYNWDIDDKGSSLNITADYLSRSAADKITTHTTDAGGTRQATTSARQASDMLRIRPIWKKVMRNNDELTAGLDYQYTNLHESNNGGTATASTHATGHTPAMFATYTGHIADKLTYEAGLRAQYDKMDVNTEDTRNRYSQWSVNPSASLTYDIDKQRGHTITLQYEHYTDQLPYGAISTFRNYLEPNHYATGNPAIKPSSGDMGQITLTLHGKFTMYARYYYDKNPIYFTNETDPDDPRLLRSMPRNGHYEQDFSIGMEQNLKPLKWWTLKATERFGLYSASTPDWKVNGQTYWIFLIDNNFKFTPTFGGGIYAYIDPKRHTDDEVWGTVWEVSCNLYKTFFDDRLTVSLYAKPYRKGRTVTVDNSLYRSMRNNMTNEEYLSLTLRFNFSSGKMKPRRAARSTQTYQKIEKTL